MLAGPVLAGPCWLPAPVTQCGAWALVSIERLRFLVRSTAAVSNPATIRQAMSGATTPAEASVVAVSQTRCRCGPGPEMSGRWRNSASVSSRR